ncbi:hypothetical protein L596_001545 [Steinernema carpocapsae]|uniref:Uncharacterized protein n=1 Tax=Steinernema carpocapsae TaxID=34508 RepID=A0A4U8ULJ2_STECR|nr:hypothetical protein L596_001545 [Steinernema carpocapsae]
MLKNSDEILLLSVDKIKHNSYKKVNREIEAENSAKLPILIKSRHISKSSYSCPRKTYLFHKNKNYTSDSCCLYKMNQIRVWK